MPKGKKSNPWMTHLAQFRKSHPNMSLGDAMVAAKKTYKKPARQAGAGFFDKPKRVPVYKMAGGGQKGAGFLDKLREKNPERFDMMKNALKKAIFGGRKMAGGKFSSMPVKSALLNAPIGIAPMR